MLDTKDLVRIALFAAVIAVLGLIPRFDLPLTSGVPITAQTLGVMLAGVVLGARNGALSVMLFLFAVGLGAPVLAGGRGGLAVFFGPTVGFLVGWIAGAWACGAFFTWWKSHWPERIFSGALFASLIGGILVMYAMGIPGLALMAKMPITKAIWVSLVFVPGDVIKALITAWLASRLARFLAA